MDRKTASIWGIFLLLVFYFSLTLSYIHHGDFAHFWIYAFIYFGFLTFFLGIIRISEYYADKELLKDLEELV